MTDLQTVPTYMVNLDQLRAYIRALMAEKHITVAKLADITGISKGTLDNFFDGTTKAPTFDKVCTIIAKLGGSVDAAIGIAKVDQPAAPVDFSPVFDAYNQVLAAKDAHITDLRSEVTGLKDELALEQEHSKQAGKWQKLFVAENIIFGVLLVAHLLSDLLFQ